MVRFSLTKKIEQARAQAKLQVAVHVESLLPGPGQRSIYAQKIECAHQYITQKPSLFRRLKIVPAAPKMLADEAARRGLEPLDLAHRILAKSKHMRRIENEIEIVRVDFVMRLQSLTSEAEIDALVAATQQKLTDLTIQE